MIIASLLISRLIRFAQEMRARHMTDELEEMIHTAVRYTGTVSGVLFLPMRWR